MYDFRITLWQKIAVGLKTAHTAGFMLSVIVIANCAVAIAAVFKSTWYAWVIMLSFQAFAFFGYGILLAIISAEGSEALKNQDRTSQ